MEANPTIREFKATSGPEEVAGVVLRQVERLWQVFPTRIGEWGRRDCRR